MKIVNLAKDVIILAAAVQATRGLVTLSKDLIVVAADTLKKK